MKDDEALHRDGTPAPVDGGGIAASKVVPNNRLMQLTEKKGIAAVNRLPLRLRPYVVLASRQARPSPKIAAGIPETEGTV